MALPAALALSGLNESHFSDGLTDIFNHGAVLLKSPKSANKSITQERKTLSLPDLNPVIAKNFFDLLVTALQSKKLEHQSSEPEDKPDVVTPDAVVTEDEELQVKIPEQDKIVYGNRDLLDLATNMKSGWNFPMAKFKSGTQYFFENRSQYTRVLGSNMPKHVMIKCSSEDCCFEAPHYDE